MIDLLYYLFKIWIQNREVGFIHRFYNYTLCQPRLDFCAEWNLHCYSLISQWNIACAQIKKTLLPLPWVQQKRDNLLLLGLFDLLEKMPAYWAPAWEGTCVFVTLFLCYRQGWQWTVLYKDSCGLWNLCSLNQDTWV